MIEQACFELDEFFEIESCMRMVGDKDRMGDFAYFLK